MKLHFWKLTLLTGVAAACLHGQSVDYRNVNNGPVMDQRRFQFTLKSGNVSSGSIATSGAKTLTIRPCPLGVAGANATHYLRISGGVGTAENVLITGGTCTSGAASGTLAFTTVNTHTGSWSITSATAGIQEGVKYLEGLSGGGELKLSFGNSTVYKTVTMTGTPAVTVSGCGTWCSTIILDSSNTTEDVFYCTSATCLVYFRDFTVGGPTGHTTGAAIHIKNNSAGRPKIQNVRAVDTAGGFYLENSDYAQILFCYYDQESNTNAVYGIKIDGVSSDIQIKGGRFAAPETNVSTMLDYGILINGGDGVSIDGVMVRGNVGVSIAPTFGSGSLLLGSIFITGGTIIDRCRTKGISIVTTGTMTGNDFFGEVYVSNSHIAGDVAMETDDLVYMDLTSMGTNYAGISFVGMKINNSNRHGIYAVNANGLNISSSRIVNNDAANGGASAIRIAGATSLSITGNTLSDFLAVPKQDYGINLSGTVTVADIVGNTAYGNVTSPYNNGATLTSAVMSGNQGSDDLVGAVTADTSVALPSSLPKTIGIAGTTTIETITGFIGSGDTRTFLCPASLNFSAAGNIKAAVGPTTANQVVRCVYNAGDSKWNCQ